MDRTRAGITGAFGVPGEKDNDRRVVTFCGERGRRVGNILSTEVHNSGKGSRRCGD